MRSLSRYLLPALLLQMVLGASIAGAQEIVQVEWLNIGSRWLNNENKEVLQFHKAIYEENGMPYLQVIKPGVLEEAKMEVLSTSPLTAAEQKLITPALSLSIQNVLITRETVYQSKKTFTSFRVCPLVIQNGAVQKVLSFRLEAQRAIPQLSPTTATTSRSTYRTTAAAASVLSAGTWYRIETKESGIYKLTYQNLKQLGLNPDNIDPRSLSLFGNHGGVLPQANSSARYDDLMENAIYVFGENDGVFNQEDYILFYANGPDTTSWNIVSNRFNHSHHPYSNSTSFYLSPDAGTGKRITAIASTAGATTTYTQFTDYQFIEQDQVNLLESGREWFGDAFGTVLSRNYNFNVPGLISSEPVYISLSAINRAFTATSFSVSAASQNLGNLNLAGRVNTVYGPAGRLGLVELTGNGLSASNGNLNVNVTFNQNGDPSASGFLNYLSVQCKRNLTFAGAPVYFQIPESLNDAISAFSLNGATSDLVVWDVTTPMAVGQCTFTLSSGSANFGFNSTELRKFAAFTGSTFPSPALIGRIANQNLHAIGSTNVPDMIIISHANFLSTANRLASHRANKGVSVVVCEVQAVYNEFSSGKQDVSAIRDFVKMVYDRGSGIDTLSSLLLLGDCSYDYKGIVNPGSSMVPCYQSRNSIEPLESYSSEDFFAFLDNAEGNWGESPIQNHIMDIAVGRIPCKSAVEADLFISKIIEYEASAAAGKWRNRMVFVADDGDGNLHLNDAEDVSALAATYAPRMNIMKRYLDAYNQQSAPGGEVCPDLNRDIDLDVNRGAFVLNYSGHGGTNGWAQEAILGLSQIQSWTSETGVLPFMVTATCDFGKYDDPIESTGADFCLFGNKSGAIGMLTSTRVVFQFSNRDLNLEFYNYLFTPVNGQMPTIGQVVMQTKNASVIGNFNRNYTLLGDPSMKLAYPALQSVLTEVNATAIDPIKDTLKALSKIKLKGEVRNAANVVASTFNGTAFITVFDKPIQYATLGTQGTSSVNYSIRNNFIFEGQASVVNGIFEIEFIVPKDISYSFGTGKISLYVKSNASDGLDAAGLDTSIVIGGTNLLAADDQTPPLIDLYLNDESFVFGGLTHPNPKLIAKLYDENGINVSSSSVGHEITSTLSIDNNLVVMNEFYSANLDDYQNGEVRYPYQNLSPGKHSLRFKAWDTYNNSSESILDFVVSDGADAALQYVLNYPNPFTTNTTFHFDHNKEGHDLQVRIQIFTVSGKLVKTLTGSFSGAESHIDELEWDGRDDFGDRIGRGVYVYRVEYRSLSDGSAASAYEKLVILQ
jgi:hypothetical protein